MAVPLHDQQLFARYLFVSSGPREGRATKDHGFHLHLEAINSLIVGV